MGNEPQAPRVHGWIWIAAIAAIVGVVWVAMPGQQSEEFCELWGALPSGQTETFGDLTLLVGEPIRNREPCNGDDLAHYSAADLAGVDGVLFDTCDISWVGGGRSSAAVEGFSCVPASTTSPAYSNL
jgi:drug/metabolite transporter (DMT)-like permease